MSIFCSSSGVTIYEEDLLYAQQQGLLQPQDEKPLWSLLQNQDNQRWKMGWVHLAYFFGGSLITGSLTWLTNQAWLDTKGLSLFYLSSVYVGIFAYAANYCWSGKTPSIPQMVGGVFAMVSVFLSPVPVWSLQRYFDYWTPNAPEIFQFSALSLSGIIAVCFIRYPLLTLPIWFGIYGIVELDVAGEIWKNPTSEQYAWVSVVCGFAITVTSIVLDKVQKIQNSKGDYAFWSYLFGLLALCNGLGYLRFMVYSDSGAFPWIYLIANAVLCMGTPLLQRNVFVVLGGFGVCSAVVNFLFTEATVAENAWLSVTFGSLLISSGIYTEKNTPSSSFPVWAFLFGSSIFFSGTATLFGFPVYTNQLFQFAFLLSDVGLCLLTLYTQYRIFFFYGVIGGLWYVEKVVERHQNSWWVPFVLTFIGLGVIALAVYISNRAWKKRREAQQKKQQPELEMTTTPFFYVYYV